MGSTIWSTRVPIQLTGAGAPRCWDTGCRSRPLCQRGRCATGRAAGPVRRRRTRGGWIHLRQRGSTDARFSSPGAAGTMMGSVCRSCPATRCMPSCLDTRPLVRHWAEAGAIQPLVGQQVTIGDGVPGLAAGTLHLAAFDLCPVAGRFPRRDQRSGGARRAHGDAGLRNGSWATSGQLSIAGTSIRDSLSRQVILSSADTLRRYSRVQRNELCG